jgi:hypothetical protein
MKSHIWLQIRGAAVSGPSGTSEELFLDEISTVFRYGTLVKIRLRFTIQVVSLCKYTTGLDEVNMTLQLSFSISNPLLK